MEQIIKSIINECNLLNISIDTRPKKDIILLCPYCLKEGKEKIKLYIRRENLTYHCFRCGAKGNMFTLYHVLRELGLTRTINLLFSFTSDVYNITNQKFKEFKSKIIKNLYLIFDDEDMKAQLFKNIKKDSLKTIHLLTESSFCTLNNTDINIIFKKYLNDRNIPEYILKIYKIPYFKGLNINHYLYGRISFPTFLLTNYESRIIYNASNIRYIKNTKDLKFYDFPFIVIKNKKYSINNIKEIDYIVITEGIFDCLTLAIRGIPAISMGGYLNSFNVMLFIELISLIYNTKIKNIIFIYDKDIDNNIFKKLSQQINFYFSNKYNLKLFKFNYENYKDINDIRTEEEISEFINELLDKIDYII